MLDPYTTLQVGRDATADEIKAAYRRLAKELHPDLNPNDPASARRFKDVTAAYNVLSDEVKRRQYDREAMGRNRGGGQSSSQGGGQAGTEDGFESFFRRSWGTRGSGDAGMGSGMGGGMGGSAGHRAQRGADVYQSMRVPFVESLLGGRRRLTVDERTIEVVIPPLTEDGQTLRLKGQGARAGRLAIAGDLFVEIAVEPHPYFQRKGYDIAMTLPVTVPEAVLGATVTVPTLNGLVQLKIPKGSNTDTVLRLRGKGVPPVPGRAAGDQLVTLKVMLPDARDPDFVTLVEEWSKRHSYTVRPKYGD
ncbi:MAG TPA: DnaJ C-terminal domain-containing protein [Stellaceae bacterium]|jgi:DnaJ-class molecular chaperone|nr:DnaJ C-terminal domain-containing protein [Stellaceae bacterium]